MRQAGIRHFIDFLTKLGVQRGSVEIEASVDCSDSIHHSLWRIDLQVDSIRIYSFAPPSVVIRSVIRSILARTFKFAIRRKWEPNH